MKHIRECSYWPLSLAFEKFSEKSLNLFPYCTHVHLHFYHSTSFLWLLCVLFFQQYYKVFVVKDKGVLVHQCIFFYKWPLFLPFSYPRLWKASAAHAVTHIQFTHLSESTVLCRFSSIDRLCIFLSYRWICCSRLWIYATKWLKTLQL